MGIGLSIVVCFFCFVSSYYYWPKSFLATLGGSNWDAGYSAQLTTDGGFIVAGSTGSFGVGIRDVLLAKYFPNGTLEWASTLGWLRYSDWEGKSVQQTTDGGFIVAGFTESFSAGNPALLLAKYYPNGTLEWVSTSGGGDTSWDEGRSVKQTTDGGFIVTGFTMFTGFQDVLLAKYFPNGTFEWASTFGGSGEDEGYSVEQTTDDGFIVVGFTESFGAGNRDVLLAKYFHDGTLEWANTLGGSEKWDEGRSVKQTTDGGFIVTGSTKKFVFGVYDVLLSKFFPNGSLEWCSTYGSGDDEFGFDDFGYSVQQTKDGGFIVTGSTQNEFALLLKYFPNGTLEWGSTLRGSGSEIVEYHEIGYSVKQTVDGEFIVTGITRSFGSINPNLFLAKTDENGEGLLDEECPNWNKIPSSENSKFIADVSAERIIELNFTRQKNLTFDFLNSPNTSFVSNIGDVLNVGLEYCSIIRECFGVRISLLDEKMNSDSLTDPCSKHGRCVDYLDKCECDEPYESVNCEISYCDGLLSNDSNVCRGHGSCIDIEECICVDEYFGDFCETRQYSSFVRGIFGGHGYDIGKSVQQTTDGGFIVAGVRIDGNVDLLLAKFFPNGTLEWASILSRSYHDEGKSVQQTIDGGFIVTGRTTFGKYGTGNYDVLLAKYFPDGTLEWASTLGKSNNVDEVGNFVQQTIDGGFIVTGGTTNEDFGIDVLLAKYFPNGTLEWVSTLSVFEAGTFDRVGGRSVRQTTDGGFIVTGETSSYGAGNADVFLAKFFPDGTLEWASSLGGGEYDGGYSVQQTKHGGYILTGSTRSFGTGNYDNILLAKFFPSGADKKFRIGRRSGVVEWISTFPVGNNVDHIRFVQSQQTDDGGFIVSLSTFSFALGNGTSDVLIKVNSEGKGCGFSRVTDSDISSTFIYSYQSFAIETSAEDVSDNFTFSYVSPNVTKIDLVFDAICTSEFECFGVIGDEIMCNIHGDCRGHDHCECDEDYYGDECEISSCFEILGNDSNRVCSGHGDCVDYDACRCDAGYFSSTPGLCDWWNCEGIHWKDENSVCNGKGKCKDFNLCECKNGFEGTYCDTWKCGDNDKDDSEVCSGRGTCEKPKQCKCNVGYKGSVCETNTLLASVMAPILSVSGFFAFVFFSGLVCLCGCCCLLVFCVSTCLLGCLITYLGYQTFRWKKFEKLKNIDILLQEQDAEDNTSIAHIRINKKLFEIPYQEIKMIKILGEGGSSSTVYLATWRNKEIAFKCFKTRNVCVSQVSFDEFEKEVEVFASISHPNVVSFYGCSMDPPRVGILMEFCENGECHQYIRKYKRDNNGVRYPMTERFRMLSEVSGAIDYLHSRNIVHRDLKCENVLLNKNEECKVMDFGLAKVSDRLSKQQTKMIGTSIYSLMAPEVATGRGTYNEKCDVFSFSIMCWILVTGEFDPYGKNETGFNIELRVSQDPKFRPNVKLMKRFLREEEMWIVEQTQKCWNNDPEMRPSFSELNLLFEEKRNEGEEKKEGKKKAFENEHHGVIVEVEEKNDDDLIISVEEFERVKNELEERTEERDECKKENESLTRSLKEILGKKEISDGEKVRMMKENLFNE